jgi:hypothetical protein
MKPIFPTRLPMVIRPFRESLSLLYPLRTMCPNPQSTDPATQPNYHNRMGIVVDRPRRQTLQAPSEEVSL